MFVYCKGYSPDIEEEILSPLFIRTLITLPTQSRPPLFQSIFDRVKNKIQIETNQPNRYKAEVLALVDELTKVFSRVVLKNQEIANFDRLKKISGSALADLQVHSVAIYYYYLIGKPYYPILDREITKFRKYITPATTTTILIFLFRDEIDRVRVLEKFPFYIRTPSYYSPHLRHILYLFLAHYDLNWSSQFIATFSPWIRLERARDIIRADPTGFCFILKKIKALNKDWKLLSFLSPERFNFPRSPLFFSFIFLSSYPLVVLKFFQIRLTFTEQKILKNYAKAGLSPTYHEVLEFVHLFSY